MASRDDQPPRKVDLSSLQVRELLGRGGFASCWHANYNGQDVALKVLMPRQKATATKAHGAAVAADAAGIDKPPPEDYLFDRIFLREARVMSQIEHRHIVRCLGAVQLPLGFVPNQMGPALAMALELCEPDTVKDLIARSMGANRRVYKLSQAYDWLVQIASALAHLHGQKPPIIHRDVKPDNVLLKREQNGEMSCKLCDFGLHAEVVDDRSTALRRRSFTRTIINPLADPLPPRKKAAEAAEVEAEAAEAHGPARSRDNDAIGDDVEEVNGQDAAAEGPSGEAGTSAQQRAAGSGPASPSGGAGGEGAAAAAPSSPGVDDESTSGRLPSPRADARAPARRSENGNGVGWHRPARASHGGGGGGDLPSPTSPAAPRNPDLPGDGRITIGATGFKRVDSLLRQLGIAELKPLRPHEMDWVYGLSGKAGSFMYMAPEVFNNLPYNEKSDVFSFGVMAYEMLASELTSISIFNTVRAAKLGVQDPQRYAAKVAEGYRPARIQAVSDASWALLEACWHHDPVERPTMAAVEDELRRLVRELEASGGRQVAAGTAGGNAVDSPGSAAGKSQRGPVDGPSPGCTQQCVIC